MHPFLRFLLLAVLTASLAGQSTTWPEWRGGSLQGTSTANSLPTRLDPGGPTQAWRVAVRGRGISSPIVVGGRVFVTTAHRYEGGLQRLKSTSVVTAGGLAVLLGIVLFVRRRRGTGFVRRLDTGVTALWTAAFVGLSLTAAFAPNSLWTLGRPGEAWLVTGAILLVGVAAAFGWSRAGSRLRWIALLALIAMGWLLWQGVPLDRYGIQHGPGHRVLMLLPTAFAALWFVLTWVVLRRAEDPRPTGTWLRGLGGASIAVAALALFASVNVWERRDDLARSLVCLDLETGATLWERVLLVAPKEQKWPSNSFATPTPCSDGERVFAYFGAGWGCVDLDGDVLWTGSDPDYVAASRYGAGASPIVDGDQILLWQENEGKSRESYLVSLDFRTGKVNWRVEPPDVHDSYATPILVPRSDGSRELVTMAYRKLVAHSTRDGARLWELKIPARQVVPSLCYAGDDLLLVSGGTHLEFSTSGVHMDGVGKDTRPKVLWQTRRNLSDICSPVLIDGSFFTIIDGRMRCITPRTGKIQWTGRLEATDYWSSLVAGDGKIYALSGDGELATVAADPREFRVLSKATFDEPCMATPAVVDGRVLVRTERWLYCFAAAAGIGATAPK